MHSKHPTRDECFFEIREDPNELWPHTRTHHFARIRFLKSEEKQKFYAARHENTANDHNISNVARNVAKETHSHFKREESATLKTRKS